MPQTAIFAVGSGIQVTERSVRIRGFDDISECTRPRSQSTTFTLFLLLALVDLCFIFFRSRLGCKMPVSDFPGQIVGIFSFAENAEIYLGFVLPHLHFRHLEYFYASGRSVR